jgi:hypothetical protein
MQDSPPADGPDLADRSGVTDAVRVQILATEHWSLLATRSMTWNEMFSRAGMFLTVLSAATVALALMAQATGFHEDFRVFALIVLPVVLIIGLATYIRLGDARGEDALFVMGMNRLRHAYLELAPELEPYFITGHHDDMAGISQTYCFQGPIRLSRILASTPSFVGVINAVVVGVITALIVDAFDAYVWVYLTTGILAGLITLIVLVGLIPLRSIELLRRQYTPLFPQNKQASPQDR